MDHSEEVKPKLPEQLADFIEELARRGIKVTALPSEKSDACDFVADTHIGRIWIMDLGGLWEPRLALPGAAYFANAAEWQACLEGRKHNWKAPTLDESINWLTTTLSKGIPTEISAEKLDQVAGFRFRHGKKLVWLASTGIAVALLTLSFGLFLVASVTKNSIAGMNAVACAIIFVIYLFKWGKLMRSLRE